MIKFNKNDILTCVTSDQAVVGTEGWAGNVPLEIKDAFLNPHELVELTDVRKSMDANYPFCVRDTKTGTADKALWLPAPYEYLQSRWVSANEVKFNDVLRVVGEWPEHPDFSDYNTVDKELTFDSVLEHSIFCHGASALNVYVPYYAVEKVKGPMWRPFANEQEFAPYRDCWWHFKVNAYVTWSRAEEYTDTEVTLKGIEYTYEDLFRNFTNADTGDPAGIYV